MEFNLLIQFLIIMTLSISYFYLINWFGRYLHTSGYMSLSLFYKADEAPIFNNMFRILAPVVLLLITSATFGVCGFDQFVEYMWVTIPLMFIFRTAFNLIYERHRLINWKNYLFVAFISSLLGFWVYKKLIVTKKYYFPPLETFGNELWLLVFLFVYQTINNIQVDSSQSQKRKNKYLDRQYKFLKSEYEEFIKKDSSSQEIIILTYAIIIIEMFNRPSVYRFCERILCRLMKKKLSTGVMQVRDKNPLSDKESIIRGIEILNENYKKVEKTTNDNIPDFINKCREQNDEYFKQQYAERLLSRVTWLYNNSDDYVGEVMQVYSILKEKYYKEKNGNDNQKDIYNAYSNYL